MTPLETRTPFEPITQPAEIKEIAGLLECIWLGQTIHVQSRRIRPTSLDDQAPGRETTGRLPAGCVAILSGNHVGDCLAHLHIAEGRLGAVESPDQDSGDGGAK